jgi:hypothetical protein
MEAFPMRFMLKLIILIAICFVLYHFFGPQIKSFFHTTKNDIHGFLEAPYPDVYHEAIQERKYYPIEKRTQ